MRATRRTAMRDLNFGATLLSQIRSDKSPRKQEAKRKKSSSQNVTPKKVKKRAATGRSFAIAALTPINRFSIAGSANDRLFAERNPASARLPHARRMGATRRHLARVAART